MRFLQMLQAFPRFRGGACAPPDVEAEPPAVAVPLAGVAAVAMLADDAFDLFELVPPFLSPPPAGATPPLPNCAPPLAYMPGSGGVVLWWP